MPGGNGVAAATSVNEGSSRAAVAGALRDPELGCDHAGERRPGGRLLLKRYDVATQTSQTILSGCIGTLAATTCVETRVPAGDWVYAVTPVFGTNWRGPESMRSTSVQVAAPRLTLASATVKPGNIALRAAAGFLLCQTQLPAG